MSPPQAPSQSLLPRLESHSRLRGLLEAKTDTELSAWLADTTPTAGFGCTRRLSLDGTPVFAKSLPLTRREFDQPGSTNLFELPTYYSYGVGSAGFGAWRELESHRKTTEWVLAGAIETFPLMLHHRLLPRTAGSQAMPPIELDKYVDYWNGSAEIRDFVLARESAEHELVVFLEFVPHVLRDWLPTHPQRLGMVMDGMLSTLAFLSERGVIHFDAHLGNVLTDGDQVFLTDFGLVMDQGFALADAEQSFFSEHRNYDRGLFVAAVVRALGAATASDPLHAEALARWQPVADWMARFFGKLKSGSKSEGGYDDAALGALLQAAGL